MPDVRSTAGCGSRTVTTTGPPPRRNVGRRGPRTTTATRVADTSADTGLDVLADRPLRAPPTAPEPDPFDSEAPFATDTEESIAGYAKHLSYSDIHQVAHAIDTGAAITVEYIATSGNRTRTLSDLELDPMAPRKAPREIYLTPHLISWRCT